MNKIIIFAAPSGSGKTTIVKHLLEKNSDLGFSISATTRKKREGETDGKDYYFLEVSDFIEKVNNNEFVEWEEVYRSKYYGTLKSEIDRIWNSGKNVIFDMDVHGGINLKNLYKEQAISVFVQPPSYNALVDRLKNRNTETSESLQYRIQKAKEELSYADKYDVVLVNDVLETALSEAQSIYDKFK